MAGQEFPQLSRAILFNGGQDRNGALSGMPVLYLPAALRKTRRFICLPKLSGISSTRMIKEPVAFDKVRSSRYAGETDEDAAENRGEQDTAGVP